MYPFSRPPLRVLAACALLALPLVKSALAIEQSHAPRATTAAETTGHPTLARAGSSGQPDGGGGHGGWSYEGRGGPDHWGQLSPDYHACEAGQQQSPIDLSTHMPSLFNDLSVHWRPTEFEMVNNGHTIQANAGSGSYITVGGERHDLLQLHFHHPSEHTVDGRPYSMEVHFVHKAASGALAVIGVFLTPGAPHEELANVFSNMPAAPRQPVRLRAPIDLSRLLPTSRSILRYSGSLTTPPCSEIVNWIVFGEPIEVSGAQIAQFGAIYPANARPIQALNRRFILGNF